MRTIGSFILLSVALALLAGGCVSRAAKEGLGTFRGAVGTYAPLRDVAGGGDAGALGQYQRFELGEFVDDFGGNTPPDLVFHLREAFPQQLRDKKIPNTPAGKTLLIRGTILHYESASTVGVALGPLEEVVARVELVDKDTGNVIGVANCIGRTTESVNIGVARKGQGLAKAIVAWLDKLYPEAGRLD